MDVIDASRVQDGRHVAIKRVKRGTNEARVLAFLSTPEKLEDPANHCVPMLEMFSDANEPEFDFLVMPFLVRYDTPPFFSVGEVMDFVFQTLEASLTLSSGVYDLSLHTPFK